jgi:hypothetical protein
MMLGLSTRLRNCYRTLYDGNPITDSLPLALCLWDREGVLREDVLHALGLTPEKQDGIRLWRDSDGMVYAEQYSWTTVQWETLAEMEALRSLIISEAGKRGVPICMPSAADVSAIKLRDDLLPHFLRLVSDAPNLRLKLDPELDQRSELAALLSTGAVDWPLAVRLILETAASSGRIWSHADLESARKTINKKTAKKDRAPTLAALQLRYGKRHPHRQKEEAEYFNEALEPYLQLAYLERYA